jgi:hypothetical protein
MYMTTHCTYGTTQALWSTNWQGLICKRATTFFYLLALADTPSAQRMILPIYWSEQT